MPGFFLGGGQTQDNSLEGGGVATLASPSPEMQVGSNVSGEATRGEKPGTFKLVEGPGPVTAQESQAWLNAQIPYRNMASDQAIAQRAVAYVKDLRKLYEEKSTTVRARWRVNRHLMNGNSVSRIPGMQDVHVPEVYKKVEQIVPRIEEAFHSPGSDWWSVQGTDEDSAVKAELIHAYMSAQLRTERVERLYRPSLRDAVVYQISVAKLSWEQRIERRVKKRLIKGKTTDDGTEEKVVRTFEDQVVYEGNRIDLIEPFDFFADTARIDEDEMMFIGHRTRLTRGQIMRLGTGENPAFENTAELATMTPLTEGTSVTDADKIWTSITERFDSQQRLPAGGPSRFVVDEVSCFFDLYGDGQEIDCILTIANEKVCLRAIENFYDCKRRPYAICRFNNAAHELFGQGIIDPAVRLNEEMDTHYQLFMHAHKLHVAPIVAIDGDTDLAENMLDVIPGTIWPNITKVQVFNTPDTLQSVPFIDKLMRTHIEEAMGSPNIWEASSVAGTTATESIQKQQEGNKRLLGYVRSYSHFWERILMLRHQFNRQFITRKQKFRVLGKAAQNLGDYAEIGPADFQADIDISFMGIDALQTLGMRATAIVQALTVSADIRMRHGNQVDELALLQKLLDLTVGKIFDRPIIKLPSPLDMMMSPEREEALLLSRGIRVKVDPRDNHLDHIHKHTQDVARGEAHGDPDFVQKLRTDHIREHALMAADQRAQSGAAQARQPAYQQDPQPVDQGGLNMNAGGTQPGMVPPEGSTGGSVALNPAGQTPGPPDAGKAQAPGRAPSTFQTQDQVG